MNHNNQISITMDSKSQNERFARIAVAAFVSVLDPTVGEINEIKTAVSEAVTNAIIHGYEGTSGKVILNLSLEGDTVTIEVLDNGVGIDNVKEAREPLYTSKPDLERSGMGFTVMETFMDNITVYTQKGVGTKIVMSKKVACSLS